MNLTYTTDFTAHRSATEELSHVTRYLTEVSGQAQAGLPETSVSQSGRDFPQVPDCCQHRFGHKEMLLLMLLLLVDSNQDL